MRLSAQEIQIFDLLLPGTRQRLQRALTLSDDRFSVPGLERR
jgi:hypothetical protein